MSRVARQDPGDWEGRRRIVKAVAGLSILLCLAILPVRIDLALPMIGETADLALDGHALGSSMRPVRTRGAFGNNWGMSSLGLDFMAVMVTAYSSTPDQTDGTPWTTASATTTRPGVLALSRDLIRSPSNPDAPFAYHDLVLVAGVGIFRVEDTMNKRWNRRADIWFPTRAKARRWGRRPALIARVERADPSHLLIARDEHLEAILDRGVQ